ncbi:MAG: energy transducer TonB [Bacteroidetes bacterium]|nr:energy transducer TonB [Bacteroidota bacterium]
MKLIPLLLLLTLSVSAQSQSKGAFYGYDADWQPTEDKSPRYMIHVHQVSDTCWQRDYYNFKGSILKSEQYLDQEGNKLNGIAYYYDEMGYLDSAGFFLNGKKNGDFFKYRNRDTFSIINKYVYKNDSLFEVVDVSKEKQDSIESAAFPGGPEEWLRFLKRNLKYPNRAFNLKVQGVVRIGFIVDAKGKVVYALVIRSVEYSLDMEALRIILKSGDWQPGIANGVRTKSYKIQPIIFKL